MDYSNGDSKGVGADSSCRSRGICMVGPVGDSEVYRPYTPQELVRAIGEHRRYFFIKWNQEVDFIDEEDFKEEQMREWLCKSCRWLDDLSICGVKI